MEEVLTQEEITRQYSATMDSVNLINNGKLNDMSDAEWEDIVKRNVEHIKIMLGKDYWTTEDLQPFRDAAGV